MSLADNLFISMCQDIIENGVSTEGEKVRPKWEDGTFAYTIKKFGVVNRYDLSKEFPAITLRKTYIKSAVDELLWIWQKKSNNIHDLKSHVWDEWADENGSIGKAYGYQVSQPVDIYLDPIHKTPESFRHYDNQVAFVLDYLKENPNGRWAKINLWNVADLKDMNLVPCCHGTDWNLDGGKLNCVLTQRSGDMPYGVPFNTTQYAMLMCKFARHLGVKPGKLVHVISDAHIYANQMDGVKEQIDYYNAMDHIGWLIKKESFAHRYSSNRENQSVIQEIELIKKNYHWEEDINDIIQHFKDTILCNPWYYIPEDITNFWDMDVEKCKIEDYKPIKEIKFGDIAV